MKTLLIILLLFMVVSSPLQSSEEVQDPEAKNTLPSSSAESEEPLSNDDDLDRLGKIYDKARQEYRDALKAHRKQVDRRMEQIEEAVEEEDSEDVRKDQIEEIRHLRALREELNDSIRVINAGDVVKFSNTKNKIVKMITRQK